MLPRHEVYDILFETFHCVLGGMQAISVSSFQKMGYKIIDKFEHILNRNPFGILTRVKGSHCVRASLLR